jgi:hypothetical protein
MEKRLFVGPGPGSALPRPESMTPVRALPSALVGYRRARCRAAASKAIRLLLGCLVLLGAVSATVASADCGDDVGGVRVPCRCGDVVVSDTTLLPTDPVVTERCSGDGLFVRARSGAESIRLDLAGQSIVGWGHGTGIHVLGGGTSGAVVVGGSRGVKGEVAGFGTGFRARGERSVRELRDIVFKANFRDGVNFRGAGTVISGVAAVANGRDGARVGGRSPRLSGVEATANHRYGVRISGRAAELDVRTSGNGAEAQRILGRGHVAAPPEAER